MEYSLKRKNSYKILYTFNEKGFVIEPKNSNTKYKVSVTKITLIDKELITHYIVKSINKKFDKLFNKMYLVLTEENEDPNDTPLILDEIAKLKSIVITKYKNYVSEEIYKNILKKLIIAEDEFAKDYNQKMFIRSIINSQYRDFEEERTRAL